MFLIGGRELFRALQEVMNVHEMDPILKELSREDESGNPTFRRILINHYKEKDVQAGGLVLMQVCPFVEQYTAFIFNSSTKLNFNKHLSWMLDKLEIAQNSISEYVLVDYVRYILLYTENSQPSHSGDRVQRWYILGWLLRYIKSDVFKMMAKQALFLDWIHYKGESGWYKVFEPSWLLIIHSITKYKELSEELIEFLFLYAKEFNPTDPDIEANVMKVFELIKSRSSTR